MIEIAPDVKIDERELEFEFIRASGPGGQNVNKAATAVQLRFDVRRSASLTEEAKRRLIKTAGKRVSREGVLVIEAKSFRTQEKNREDALARFAALLRRSLQRRKPRLKTKPTQRSREKRMESKKRRGEIKKSRQSKSFE